MSNAVEVAKAALLKQLGENSDVQAVTQFIDTGCPRLNRVVSGKYDGGLPYGRIVEMFGDSSTGKTALATKWMVETQRLGGAVAFIDFERSFQVDFAVEMGLNTERPFWYIAKPRTWEEGNTKAIKFAQIIRESKAIPDDAPILIVLDSIAAAIPLSSADKAMDELSMADTTALARTTSNTLKIVARYAEELNATFLYLNQVRLKPGVMYGDPRTTPGGRATEYYASVRLALGRTKNMGTVDGEKCLTSQTITVKAVKNKIAPPFRESEIEMSFDDRGMGIFNVVPSLVDHLKDKKIIESNGAWLTWEGKKFQKSALVDHIISEGQQHKLTELLMASESK